MCANREDETMHLLEGALEVTVGPRVLTLNAGESYFAPRTITAPPSKP